MDGYLFGGGTIFTQDDAPFVEFVIYPSVDSLIVQVENLAKDFYHRRSIVPVQVREEVSRVFGDDELVSVALDGPVVKPQFISCRIVVPRVEGGGL